MNGAGLFNQLHFLVYDKLLGKELNYASSKISLGLPMFSKAFSKIPKIAAVARAGSCIPKNGIMPPK